MTFRKMSIQQGSSDFSDVTLACEDGQQIEAHKVILAASSPFFQNLLRRNRQVGYPIIYMRGKPKHGSKVQVESEKLPFVKCVERKVKELQSEITLNQITPRESPYLVKFVEIH